MSGVSLEQMRSFTLGNGTSRIFRLRILSDVGSQCGLGLRHFPLYSIGTPETPGPWPFQPATMPFCASLTSQKSTRESER